MSHLTSAPNTLSFPSYLIMFKQEFCDFSEAEERALFPIVMSRVNAFNWIVDCSQPWGEVDLDFLYTLPR